MKHLLKLSDLSEKEIVEILNLADQLKYEKKNGIKHHLLKGKTLGLIFEKSSTRTRVSFEVGMYDLGGNALFLSSRDLQIGRGEPVQDTARVLSRYLDGIMIRTFAQSEVEDLAKYGSIPIINGLTDYCHPCQVLADLMTIREHKGTLAGRKMCYIGDGNNMTNSIIVGCIKMGMEVAVACPKGYEPDADIMAWATETGKFTCTDDVFEAAKDADVLYTDVWVSMGEPIEVWQERIDDLSPYQVNSAVMENAGKQAIFMHCLPSYHDLNTAVGREMGEKFHREAMEVTDEVFESSQSVVFDEAENRMHTIKAVMAATL